MPGLARPKDLTSDGISQEIRNMTALAMMEMDLGNRRRDLLTTTEFKDRRDAYVSSSELQTQRLVNKRGTEEHRIAQAARVELDKWNDAWTQLKDDGTADDGLGEVNEGLGQTHRGKLQADESVRNYTGEDVLYGGSRGRRGERSGGRGGGYIGRGSGQGGVHRGFKDRAPPVTRTRAVKGQSVNFERPMPQANLRTTESADIKAARDFTASAEHTSKKVFKTPKTVRSSRNVYSKQVARPAEDIMAPTNKTPGPIVSYEGKLVSPTSFMATIRGRSNSTSTSSSTVRQPSKHHANPPAISLTLPPAKSVKCNVRNGNPNIRPVMNLKSSTISFAPEEKSSEMKRVVAKAPPATDLMDLDMDKGAITQPVLDFTQLSIEDHIRALEVKGVLSLETINMLKDTVQKAQVPANHNPKSTSKPAIKVETMIPAVPEPQEEPTVSAVSEVSGKAGKYRPSELVSLPPGTASMPKNVVTSHLGTEDFTSPTNPFHAHVVQFQDSGPRDARRSIAMQFAVQRKTLVGEHVHRTRFQIHDSLVEGFRKLSVADEVSLSASANNAEINPNRHAKKPELSRSTKENRFPTKADTFEYSKDHPSGPQKPTINLLSLPAHLRALTPAANTGAAACAQYGADAVAAPIFRGEAKPLSSIWATEPLQSALGPSQIVMDSSVAHHSTSGDILSGPSTGQLSSTGLGFVQRLDSTSSAKTSGPARMSKFNTSGFVGLAARARADQKVNENPSSIASSKGG